MIEETVDLRFLAKQGQKIIEDMRAFRSHSGAATYEYSESS
jgi:hypothetical protein